MHSCDICKKKLEFVTFISKNKKTESPASYVTSCLYCYNCKSIIYVPNNPLLLHEVIDMKKVSWHKLSESEQNIIHANHKEIDYIVKGKY